MSSTNRSDARDSHVSDYYVTPQEPIINMLTQLHKFEETKDYVLTPSDYLFLDPCAGGDSLNKMSYPEALKKLGCPEKNIKTIDIREDSLAGHKSTNYLTFKLPRSPHCIITNPPFNLAKEIILKALQDVEEGGLVIMLLRLNFFGSNDRKQFWENNMPLYTFVHRKRISFTKGSTDSIEYMHCVWKADIKQNFTRLEII